MRALIDPDSVAELFDSGIDAVLEQAALLDATGWEAAACGEWTAAETARHVLAVSRWYHSWLDRALAGDVTRPFDSADMDRHNAEELSELSRLSGIEAATEFAITARDYLTRVIENWDLPYAYPYGNVTAGLHAGVAATEWHLHAWDLSTVTGHIHDPKNAKGLFLAAGACVAAAEGGRKGALLARATPLFANRRPWPTLVTRSGRTPVG